MISAFVINLDRDTHKWTAFQKAFQSTSSNIRIERFPAVDGKQYRKTPHTDMSTWAHQFNTNKTIGCFKSHTAVWKQVVERDLAYAMVLEDDVDPTENWEQRVFSTLKDMSHSPWDVILLGYHSQYITQHSDKNMFLFPLLKFINLGKKSHDIANGIISPVAFGGAHAYLISNQGSRKLLALCKTHNGVPIDGRMTILHATGDINVAACVPPLITTYGASDATAMSFFIWTMNDGVFSVGGCEMKNKHVIILCGLLLMLFVTTRRPVFIYGMVLTLGVYLFFCILFLQ